MVNQNHKLQQGSAQYSENIFETDQNLQRTSHFSMFNELNPERRLTEKLTIVRKKELTG